MALPKITQPLFPVTIPSTGKKTTFRAFTVKEEKALLIAQESKDSNHVMIALKQLIESCVQDVNVKDLAIFDVEYLLLKIRSKSADNIVEFNMKDEDTDESVKFSVDLDKLDVVKQKDHTNIIDINSDIKMVMRYPKIDDLANSDSDNMFSVIDSCIDKIVEGEEVYMMSEASDEERRDFIDSLNTKVLSDIKTFFDTMPKVKHVHTYKNKNGDEKSFTLEGLDSFFT